MTTIAQDTTAQDTVARRTARGAASTIMIILVIIVFGIPFLWVVVSSFKSQQTIFADLVPFSFKTFIPTHPTLANYRQLFIVNGFARKVLNSFLIAAMQVAGALLLCTPAAYALTRLRFRGRGLIFALILVTFMVPVEALLVPLYSVLTGLGLQNTLEAVALPWVANVFGLFLLRQHFQEIPRELDEAARIDGASHLRVLWSVILPSVRAGLSSMALIVFLFSWNSFLWPLVINGDPNLATIQVALSGYLSPSPLSPPMWGLIFAGAVVAVLPLVILFLFLQRYFVRGLASTGLK
jgi:ABC-type glycerol-3-phosphate transport system permease component